MKKNIGILFSTATLITCLAACGDDDPQAECTFNDECTGDRVCTNGLCVDPAMTVDNPDMTTAPQDMGTTPTDMGADPTDTGTPQPDAQPDLVEDSGPSGGCTFDDDCAPSQICNAADNVCEETCIDDLDCFVGEECVPRTAGAGMVCRPEQSGCTENADCTEQPDGICFNGECDYPVQADDIVWIKILDESTGQDACNQTDPGSDIMGARLLDGSGQLLGWAEAGNDVLGDSGMRENRYTSSVRLDGSSNGLDGRFCPESGTRLSELMPPPLSLGCGGWVLLRFIDSAGQPLEIADGFRIEVLEYGPQCGGSDADAYSVYLCTDTANAQGGSDMSCTSAQGALQGGFSSITVSL